MFTTPVGYIGWAEHYNKSINKNVYFANVNAKYIDEHYKQYVANLHLEMVEVIPN